VHEGDGREAMYLDVVDRVSWAAKQSRERLEWMKGEGFEIERMTVEGGSMSSEDDQDKPEENTGIGEWGDDGEIEGFVPPW